MAQFEEYLRKQQEVNKEKPYQQYYEQVNKELEYKRHPYAMDYTAEDMGEMFEDRMKNTTYQQRTQYYFEDHKYLLAKAKRYVKMSEDKETLKKYSATYDNKDAKDRKNAAEKAALKFREAWVKSSQQAKNRKNKTNLPKTYYDVYKQREEIMKLRLEGMLAAAEAKARGYGHEEYLKLRAKLSCYTILRDQVVNLYHQAQDASDQAATLRDFEKKLKSIDKKLKDIKHDISAKMDSKTQQWHYMIDLNDQRIDFKVKARTKKGIEVSDQAARAAVCLNTCIKSMGDYDAPFTVPLVDDQKAPISVTERKKQKWNEEYRKAVEKKDLQKVRIMKLQAIERFEKYQIPAINDMKSKGITSFFMADPGQFMEFVFYAAPFYTQKLKTDPLYQDYAQENPKFVAKVKFMMELHTQFRVELISQYNLKQKTGGIFEAERPTRALKMHQDGYKAYWATLRQYYNAYVKTPASKGASSTLILEEEERMNAIPTERLDGSDDGEELDKKSNTEEKLDLDIIDTSSKPEEPEEPGEIKTEKNRNIINEKIDEQEEENNNRIIIDKDTLKTDDIMAADLAAQEKVHYYNANSKRDLVFEKKEPKNIDDAIAKRKYLLSNVITADLEKNNEVKSLYTYYDLCVKQYLKTQTPTIKKTYLVKKPTEGLNLYKATYLRNRITENGLDEKELPKDAKDVYDYYDKVVHDIEEKEKDAEKVTEHQKRPVASHQAFLNTNLDQTYERQVRNSLDCWSCAGSGILNHYLRNTNGAQHVSQEVYRHFEPHYRKMEDLGLDSNDAEDQAYYEKLKGDIDEFTIKNRGADRVSDPVMGNPYMMSDFYLQEFAKHNDLKNTAVRKMEFHCISAQAQDSEDSNLLHNLEQKFKDTVNKAIQKDSAVSLLLGMHYVTITGINGDQLEVCDSNNDGIIDNTTYKVSSLFNPENYLYNLELVWFEQIEDPKTLAEDYKNLNYNEHDNSFACEKQSASENIALVNGVEAWKEPEEKDGDISLYYAEGIYLPKTFTLGVPRKQYEPASRQSHLFRQNGGNANRNASVKEKTAEKQQKTETKKETTKTTKKETKPAPKKETKKETKKAAGKTAKPETIVFDVDTSMDKEDVIGINPYLYLNPEHAAEFDELRKTNPNLTLRGYRYYRRFRKSQSAVQIIRAGQSKEHTLSEPLNALLLDVHWKSNREVFPEYKGNKKENEEWILSWADAKKKKDRKALDEKRVKLAQDRLIRVLNQMELPTFLELGNGWIERQMDQNYVQFTGDIRRMSAMSRLLERLPDLKAWMETEERQYLNAKLKAAQAMAAYVENYMLLHYGFSPMNDMNGCTMKAPLKKKKEAELNEQLTDSLFDSYVKDYNRYSDQEVKKTMELKKFYTLKAKLEYAGKGLHKERQDELKQTPEYLKMMAEEKEERERERKNLLKEKEEKKLQEKIDAQPGLTKEIIQKSEEIQRLMQEVQKETEKNPENRKPLDKKSFPTLVQLENGWVEDMFQNHPKELIELMQNGKDAENEDQADAIDSLKAIITVELAAIHGVRFSLDGKTCTAVEKHFTNDMKSYIEKTLTTEYVRSYCTLMGLDEKKVLGDYLKSIGMKQDLIDRKLGVKKDENVIIGEEKNENEIILNEEKEKVIIEMKGEKKEGKKKEDKKKEENQNEIILNEEKEKVITEMKGEKREDKKKEDKKKEENQNEIILNEEKEKVIIDEDYNAKVIRSLTEEEQEFLDKENKNRKEKDQHPPIYAIAYVALEKSCSYYVKNNNLRRAIGEVQNRGALRKMDSNGPMGAMSPLLQSVQMDEEDAKTKGGFNMEWVMLHVGLGSQKEEKKTASQKKIDEMIRLNLGNAFNGFKIPSPEELEHGWVVKTLQDEKKSVQLFEVLRKAQGIPKLKNEHNEAVRYCKDHPDFQKMADALIVLNDYVNYYLSTLGFSIEPQTGFSRHHINYNAKMRKEDEKNMERVRTGEYMRKYKALSENQIKECAESELNLVFPEKNKSDQNKEKGNA